MERPWGEVVPVPEANLRPLAGGEALAGGFRVAYTPGHASHHVAYLHDESGRAFVGDVAGVRIPPADLTLPPTPPPDIDIDAWNAARSHPRRSAWCSAPLRRCSSGPGSPSRCSPTWDPWEPCCCASASPPWCS